MRLLSTASIFLIVWAFLSVSWPAPAAAGTSFGVNRIRYVEATGTPVENCQSLRDTLSSITDNSVLNKYVVRLEPADYSCGSQPVVVGSGVTLVGSGGARIIGNIDNNILGVVHLTGSSTRLQDLFVWNNKSSAQQKAIGVSINTFSFSSSHVDFIELRNLKILAPDLALSAKDADIEVWNSMFFEGLVQHDSSTDPDDPDSHAFFRYSLFPGVQGTGVHRCLFSATVATATELDNLCQPQP